MIPVFEAEINEPIDGIFKISLVDAPAVESNFFYFEKQNKEIKHSIQNEEQRIVSGVLMRADFPIYRYDNTIGEYYIRYSKETIKKMAEKMLLDGTQNNINLFHTEGTDVDGVNLLEIFIKDSSKGISPVGFEDIEEGSLFCSYKVENDSVWDAIKDGTFMGFSLEGIFTIDIENKVDEFKKQSKIHKNNIMNTITKKMMNAIVKFGSVNTDKGELFWVGEAELEIGDELFKDTEDGRVKVEDGEYKTERGDVIVVTDGLVSEIRNFEGDPEAELELDKKKTACEEEVIVEEPKDETIVEEPKDDKYDELKRDIDALRAEHDELKGMVEQLRDEVAELLQKPAAEPIVEEFEKAAKMPANSKISNALKVVGTLRK